MIVVLCPEGVVTGGPEALHQLVDMANQVRPGSAFICYTPFEGSFKKNEAYDSYNAPTVLRENIPLDAVIVIPEIFPELVFEFDQRCVLWWLSVDNFPREHEGILSHFCLHAVQCEYARAHLRIAYQLESVMLSDYIHFEFTTPGEHPRQKAVAVNPRKGADLIEDFRSKNPNIPVVVLENLNRLQLRDALGEATVFVDFGHHPGKDRLPREATLQNVVVYVRRAGAAQFSRDVPLSDEYLFDDHLDLAAKVHRVFNDYQNHLECQSAYRHHVLSQQKIFQDEVSQFLGLCESLPRPMLKAELVKNYRERRGELVQCPICYETVTRSPQSPEDATCRCGATWRDQANVMLVHQVLRQKGFNKATPEFPPDGSVVGLGINDSWLVDRRLSRLFRYTNSFTHRFPTFDARNPPLATLEYFDFVSCSFGLDCIAPPAADALVGILKVLKPGGFALFGVASSESVETEEYYPGLKDWFLKDGVMYWWDDSGVQHRNEHPVKWGASELVPVLRRWSIHDLITACQNAGFSNVCEPANLPPVAKGAVRSNFGSFVIANC